MNFPFFHAMPRNAKEEQALPPLAPVPQHAHNVYEGSEFLDDAIRIADLPLGYIEAGIALHIGIDDH